MGLQRSCWQWWRTTVTATGLDTSGTTVPFQHEWPLTLVHIFLFCLTNGPPIDSFSADLYNSLKHFIPRESQVIDCELQLTMYLLGRDKFNKREITYIWHTRNLTLLLWHHTDWPVAVGGPARVAPHVPDITKHDLFLFVYKTASP